MKISAVIPMVYLHFSNTNNRFKETTYYSIIINNNIYELEEYLNDRFGIDYDEIVVNNFMQKAAKLLPYKKKLKFKWS